jgi:subtilase family serine protease
VESWLKANGFQVNYVPTNNHYVSAEGTVAEASAAFGTTFGLYAVDGLLLRSPSSALTVPSSLGSLVTGVVGLDDSAQFVHNNAVKADPNATPTPAFVNAPPCSNYWAEQSTTAYPNPYGTGALPYVPCGYTPQQVKGAYGISGYDGSGQTVAIIDAYASPTIQQDLDTWSARRGLGSTKIVQVVAPGTYHHPERGQKQDPQGWYGEETLDVEAVHGMAPAATIVYVGAPNNFQDLDAAMNHVVDRHLAQIVTNSYGFSSEFLPSGFIRPLEETFIQGAAEGIGIYFSSGDNSDESKTLGGLTSTDWPASSPWVTAVGGTSLAVGASNNYLFETGWGTARSRWIDGAGTPTTTSCPTLHVWCPKPPGRWQYGSGGGVSRIFAEPSYQVGTVPQSVFTAQHRTGRAVPDISALGDPNTGYLIGQTQTFPNGTTMYSEYRIGGTSLSSPIMAGIMALADQAKGAPHGFANPVFYQLDRDALHDIVNPGSMVAVIRNDFQDFVSVTPVKTTLRTMNQTLSLQTTPGWDDVTGLGTPTDSFLGAISR